MQNGPEMRRGWRTTIEIEERRFEIWSDHHSTKRMPRGHEIARQAVRGRPLGIIDVQVLQWGISDGRRRVCTLELNPNGSIRAGTYQSRPGISFMQAAEAAIRYHARLPKQSDRKESPPGQDGET
jgi:hypothetical protein